MCLKRGSRGILLTRRGEASKVASDVGSYRQMQELVRVRRAIVWSEKSGDKAVRCSRGLVASNLARGGSSGSTRASAMV